MNNQITLLDGAVGTSLWEKADRLGIRKDPVWIYNIEHPELVTELAEEFVNAGSQIILTNTFGANRQAVRRSSKYEPEEVVCAGVRLVKDAVRGCAKIALSAGPLFGLLEPYGDITEEECLEIYQEQLGAGMQEGPDCIMLQTFMDVEMMRIATTAAKQFGVPVYCTMTFEKSAHTMMGNTVGDVIDTLAPLGIDGIGMNCSLGPDLALPVIREFHEKTDLPLVFKPNAGKPILAPSGETITDYTPEKFAAEIAPALEFVSFIGGCCGCNAEFVRAIGKLL